MYFLMQKGDISNLCFYFLCMFYVLVLWPDDDPSLGSRLAAVQIKLFTSELDVIVNICRYKLYMSFKIFRDVYLLHLKFIYR